MDQGREALADLFSPPRPKALWPWEILAKILWRGDGDLLSFLPARAYRQAIGSLGFSRRGIVIVNAPELVREVLYDKDGLYPKSDLMVGALEPLVGRSMFIAEGADWARQRRMIEPAFSAMRVGSAFEAMAAAVDDFEQRLVARNGEPLSLDFAMSELTADIICRTVFSKPLASDTAKEIFAAFRIFQEKVAQVEIKRLLLDKAWQQAPQSDRFLQACERIRALIGELIDAHPPTGDDLAHSVMNAVDSVDGRGFTRQEVVNQLAVFFLAGHETTASVLTWTLFMIGVRPEIGQTIRTEIEAICGSAELQLSDVKRLARTRNIFREAMRLYPPITFFPRVAAKTTKLGGKRLKRGTLVMISPWVVQRHQDLWPCPHQFDPERFAGGREHEIKPGSYMPFGQGPRVCPGAAFATIEATLILARLVRRFDIHLEEGQTVEPVARLTTKPRHEINCRFVPVVSSSSAVQEHV